MKADRDDAPEHLKRKRDQSIGKWTLAIALGLGLSGLALHMAGNKLSFLPKPQPSQPPNLEKPAPSPNENTPKNQPQKTSEELFWESVNARNQQNQPKQNFYDDSNYTPKKPANTYTPPATHRATSSPQQTQQRQTRQVSRERTSKWIKSWNGGTNYLAEWLSVNNYIDSTSVCANHRRGSIDYRECRKAAKQHFHEQCRIWRARYDNDRKTNSDRMKTRYCTAASSFRPMG
ncbi:hypothetical protein IPC600_31295 [Pseudomonas aeruginosa]|uniref:hypothetical protein n=1 Tax=Pseudomonas aeruginosa TaxID=287 RepID=UPI00093BB4BD|nr:hypothetical protein [Pseudomonas aeruginosa]ELK4740657.1 hypothetical protein [Pseudomonas aeruginosa]ELK4900663.1 hypothetical protein [Pseudomonas aeruginosa]KAB5406191.1 hypothetical protein F8132_30340 [Pseudomonas aeruginosa]MBG4404859.1 hypothetical protein [Pseudomonas aeruginosa]MBG4772711.1 hypothetical protein [Pseudomonas aeruginosa]